MKYLVEYYACSTQQEEVEAGSEEEAKNMVLSSLQADYDQLGKPTDWMYGIRDVQPVEEDEIEEELNP